jgi:hypothetical protein
MVQIVARSIIVLGMNNVLKVVLGILGLILLAITPYFWFVNPTLLWIACPLLCVWAFWLMMEYLRWARSLSNKK